MEKKRDKRNIEGWKEALKDLPESYKEWFREEKEFLKKYIEKNSKVIEIGCGNGRSLKDVLEITPYVLGVDIDEKAVKDAKKNLKPYNHVNIILADGKNIPLKEKTFNYATCIGTFANLGDKKNQVLQEMKRLIKDNGKIIISVYSDESMDERLALYNKLNFKIMKIESNRVVFDDFKTEGISEQFSEEEMKEIAEKTNLKVDEIKKTSNKLGILCILSKG